MEQNPKLTIDIYATAEYATDSIPESMIEQLKKNPNFNASSPNSENDFLIGVINGKKIAVICGKETSYDNFVKMVDKALIENCDRIFASTPHHADKYDYLKQEVNKHGHYLIETSPLFMKIATGHHQDAALQKRLTTTYVEMLLNTITI